MVGVDGGEDVAGGFAEPDGGESIREFGAGARAVAGELGEEVAHASAPVADRVDGDGELLRGAGEGLDAGVGALGEEAERDVRELLNHCGEDGGRENGGGSAAGGERTAGWMRGGGCSAAEGRSDDAQLVRARTLVLQGGDELDVRLLRLGEHDGVHRAGARSAVPARSAVATLARARHDSARENPSSSASRLVASRLFSDRSTWPW